MISVKTIEPVFNLRVAEFYEARYKTIDARLINHISEYNSKMPCRTWDLPAVLTCKGSFNSDGSVCDACKVCYASKRTFLFKNVKQNRLDNMLAWRSDKWVEIMTAEIKRDEKIYKDNLFRFFASGDGEELELWEKILLIVKACKETRFWIPTRMYKFSEYRPIIDKLNNQKNCVVRFSGDDLDGEPVKGKYISTIIRKPIQLRKDAFICPSYLQGGKCLDCKECWSKDRKEILYPLH